MKSYNDANIWWISRVPETSTAAKAALQEVDEQWQALLDGSGDYVVRTMDLPQGKERWVIVRTHAQVQASKEQMEKKVKKAHQEWENASGTSPSKPLLAKPMRTKHGTRR